MVGEQIEPLPRVAIIVDLWLRFRDVPIASNRIDLVLADRGRLRVPRNLLSAR